MTVAAQIKSADPKTVLFVATVVFVLAFGVRVGLLAVRGVKTTPDTVDYVRLGQNLRAHGEFSLDEGPEFTATIRRAPLYPIFLAAFVSNGQVPLTAVAVVQAIIDAGVAVLIVLLTSAAVNARWGLAAGLAYASHPGAIHFSTSILSEPLFTALTIIGVLLALYGFVRNQVTLAALAGVVFGMATLCRPVVFPLPFLMVGIALLVARDLPRRWLHGTVLIACLALVLTPWLIRCASVSGHFLFVQGFTPTLLYVATLTDWDQKDEKQLWQRFASEDPYGRRLNSARTPSEVVEADRLGLGLALQNIRANPANYLALRIRSFPYLFITSFDMVTGANKSYSALLHERDLLRLARKILLLIVFSLLPFLLATVGLVRLRKNLASAFCATVWIYTLLVHFPVWIEYRYWMPAVPFLLVSAALGAQRLVVRSKSVPSARGRDSQEFLTQA